MDERVFNFCDDAMLSRPQDYTDDANNVLLDKMAQELLQRFTNGFKKEWANDFYSTFSEIIQEQVNEWWSRYPLAFKYRNYEFA